MNLALTHLGFTFNFNLEPRSTEVELRVFVGCEAEEAVEVDHIVLKNGNGYAMNIINPVVVTLSKELVVSARTQSVTKVSSILGSDVLIHKPCLARVQDQHALTLIDLSTDRADQRNNCLGCHRSLHL